MKDYEAKYIIQTASNGDLYFTLHAPNGQEIARSGLYKNRIAIDNAMASVRKWSQTEKVEEVNIWQK